MQMMPKLAKAVVDGKTLEYAVCGSGKPVIVLVNGAGGPIEGWYKIYADLEKLGTVIAYNRLGMGGSSKPTEAQTGSEIVNTLRALLGEIGKQPPYILVGHSLGGLYVNLFARQYPQEIAGVVFLDATAPDDVRLLPQEQGGLQRVAQHVLNVIFGKDIYGETQHTDETVTQIEQAGSFPNVPLIVVTGGKPARIVPQKVRQIREANQKLLTTLSPQGRQIIAVESGHFPQFSEPNVVIQAIQAAIAGGLTDQHVHAKTIRDE